MSTDQEASSISKQSSNPASIRRKKKHRNWIVLCLILVAAVSAYYWQQGGDGIVENEPLIVSVEIGDIVNTIASTGSLQPFDLVDVGAQVSGQLQKLHVDIGDLVEQGQLLAEIDARVQENRVAASRANIEAQEAQIDARKASLELARNNAARQERLRNDNATSQLDYDNAINSLASARASLIQLEKQIIQSRASLASDETELEFTNIYAPAAGTVVSIEMNEGRTLNASQQAPTILTIADLSIMTVETEISEADIGNVKKGLKVYFTTLGGGDRRWHSTLRQILPTPNIDNNVVLYTGLFDIENSDAALFSEMTAQVYFITSSARNVVTVPVGALTYTENSLAGVMPFSNGQSVLDQAAMAERMTARRTEGASGQRSGGASRSATGPNMATVQLVNDDGTFEQREVLVGVTSRVSAEVVSGLQVGDRVVAGIIQSNSPAAEGGSGNSFRGPPGGFRGF